MKHTLTLAKRRNAYYAAIYHWHEIYMAFIHYPVLTLPSSIELCIHCFFKERSRHLIKVKTIGYSGDECSYCELWDKICAFCPLSSSGNNCRFGGSPWKNFAEQPTKENALAMRDAIIGNPPKGVEPVMWLPEIKIETRGLDG